MLTFTEHAQQSWVLCRGEKEITIHKNVAGKLKNQDIIALNFLFQNFKNKFQGSILNEEDGFATQLQVAVLFNIIHNHYFTPKQKFIVLVVSPGYLIQKWNNRLENYGGLKVRIVDSKTNPADFIEESRLALLVSFEDLKGIDVLLNFDMFSVVIDHFDVVANKMIIKKLSGNFNIGITRRNFFKNPDQKLQWTMLNWANPGAVGRLIDFYEVDNDNYANACDNYHYWWLTLTWEFCEKFQRNSDEEDEASQLSELPKVVKGSYKSKKRKVEQIDTGDDLHSTVNSSGRDSIDTRNNPTKRNIRSNYKKNLNSPSETNMNEDPGIADSGSSSDATIEYDLEEKFIAQEEIPNSNNSSQTTIEYNEEDIPDSDKTYASFEGNDILMGIIKGNGKKSNDVLDHESQVHLKKEELYSQIFNDAEPEEANTQASDSSESFLLSLI